MEPIYLDSSDNHYPQALISHEDARPTQLASLGNLNLLETGPVALFCSSRCPGNVIIKTYDLAKDWRHAGVTVISGFHSPIERVCLDILLAGDQPIIICPARGLEDMRILRAWKQPLEAGRLLILSPFAPKLKRPTVALAKERNKFVAALAQTIFIAHAAPGSQTSELAQEILAWGKPVMAFEDEASSTYTD